MANTIFLIHGRSWKPTKAILSGMWLRALRAGIARDRPARLARFDAARIEFMYFGNLSNRFLRERGEKPERNDVRDRNKAFADLQRYDARDFNKRNYRSLPGYNPIPEFLADTVGAFLGNLSIGQPIIEAVAPDMREYWNPDTEFGSLIRGLMIAPLCKAMDRNDKIMVVGHSLGCMMAYDTFWKFSHTGEYRSKYSKKKIDLFLTFGCPLGDEVVKQNLKGARIKGPRRYPTNIRRWVNVAAHDDYIAHDQRIRDDYKQMRELNLIESITDKRIYNLAVRHGKSNPHHSCGYLINPYASKLVSDWL